ncbi:HIT domain-containing protein [Gilvimarinus sp. F26214L]|uniref:HIT domain-containing protein n=1 Tax=Gilvimarinus sp. DZF01 TaxID=3461371 RepID=UPI004045D213
MFALDPQLEKDTVILGQFPLSLVLLSRDANYPWCILVPRREAVRDTDQPVPHGEAVREIHHLADEDQIQLIKESSHLAEVMVDLFVPDKMNVAVLGNVVPQLHVHHVARFRSDPAWPGPVWGAVEAKPYRPEELEALVHRLRSALAGEDFQQA